ncbi:MAG: endolytic transglycosylase MltG [Armatimonadetes bacterium]|nr:endolytic transglycosylase MltG [Armatimonadota bacterium]NIM23937.1 endolytic transglycosylase MltG [Armatimonadota bacterium]NIM67784.1 endolytic transglycosylase MltG [Armatimonadota bacterium]NIM76324.1 endolytic transglycosylase MltG [Armatimonadota bacterium]NIN06018.1 endolytic transglycosylase MltG [Armatimonadota bacterium]
MKKLIVLIVIIGSLALAGWLWLNLHRPKSSQARWQMLTVPSGMPMLGLADSLQEAGLVSPFGQKSFITAAVLTGKGRRLQPGRYRLSPSQTPWQILTFLEEGRVHTIRVTIPEGLTSKQIDVLLHENGISRAGEFLALTTVNARSFSTPFPKGDDSLEGYLFPDTYDIDGRQGTQEVICKMLNRFEEVVWDGLLNNQSSITFPSNPSETVLNLHEIITLASLVEAEARLAEERPLIGGVLLNRLHKGMRLECDATVQYALDERKSRLSYADLETPSPYNTYLHFGLPPGPINNPGRASIEAVLRPGQSLFLFYVARPDGSHIFSRTFKEHRAAIARLNHAGLREQ